MEYRNIALFAIEQLVRSGIISYEIENTVENLMLYVNILAVDDRSLEPRHIFSEETFTLIVSKGEFDTDPVKAIATELLWCLSHNKFSFRLNKPEENEKERSAS